MASDVGKVHGLDEFIEWVENYCVDNGIPDFPDSEEYREILEMKYEEIISLSSDECFAKAILLMNYAGLLQRKHDLVYSQYSWCREALNYLTGKYWNNFDRWIPLEIRRQMVIIDNEYAKIVEAARLKLDAALQCSSEMIKDIKKRVSLLQDLGKTKGFK